MRAFHRLVQRGWGSALWLLVLLILTTCGEDLDYVVIDLSGIPSTAKGLRLSVDVDGGMAPMDGHTGASTARVAVALRRSLSGSYTVVIEAQGEGTCVTARGSLTLQLAPMTAITTDIQLMAFKALDSLFKQGLAYKKAGVMLTDLVPDYGFPQPLWEIGQSERMRELMANVDRLNRRYGRETVQCGTFVSDGKWRMQMNSRSPRYTTRWDELLKVVC